MYKEDTSFAPLQSGEAVPAVGGAEPADAGGVRVLRGPQRPHRRLRLQLRRQLPPIRHGAHPRPHLVPRRRPPLPLAHARRHRWKAGTVFVQQSSLISLTVELAHSLSLPLLRYAGLSIIRRVIFPSPFSLSDH